jgi:hypothetical protein
MYYMRKLKPDRSVTGLIPVFVITTVAGLTWIFFGVNTALIVTAILIFLYALFSFTTYLRTHNTGYLISTLYQLSLALVVWTTPWKLDTKDHTLPNLFFLSMIVFGIWMIYLAVNKKLKWRGREIFELAAAPVEEAGHGFTGRPLSAGKIESTKRDILGFAEFTARNLIALSYTNADKVVFVPVKMGKEFGHVLRPNPDITKGTWVAFDFYGNVSVSISKEDYLDYQEDLSFDQLCESMGNLFVEFLELFKRGEGVRIIDRMDALQLGIFS